MAWPVTSYLAQMFRAAGFIALGRTNVPEFGTTVTTEPMSFPAARNPWNPGHSTGGSSGGSAAAVNKKARADLVALESRAVGRAVGCPADCGIVLRIHELRLACLALSVS
jgi:amidase